MFVSSASKARNIGERATYIYRQRILLQMAEFFCSVQLGVEEVVVVLLKPILRRG